MSKKSMFEQVLDEIVAHVGGTRKYLFVGISDSNTAESLAALADTLERFWILRSDDKTFFFICDDGETSWITWWTMMLSCRLYLAGRGLPGEIRDERIIRALSDLSYNLQTVRFLPAPKFVVRERIQCGGYFGRVLDLSWGYQGRVNVFSWTYKIAWEDKGPNLMFAYIPESFLQKENEKVAHVHNA